MAGYLSAFIVVSHTEKLQKRDNAYVAFSKLITIEHFFWKHLFRLVAWIIHYVNVDLGTF